MKFLNWIRVLNLHPHIILHCRGDTQPQPRSKFKQKQSEFCFQAFLASLWIICKCLQAFIHVCGPLESCEGRQGCFYAKSHLFLFWPIHGTNFNRNSSKTNPNVVFKRFLHSLDHLQAFGSTLTRLWLVRSPQMPTRSISREIASFPLFWPIQTTNFNGNPSKNNANGVFKQFLHPFGSFVRDWKHPYTSVVR